jgi:hypothetical protein
MDKSMASKTTQNQPQEKRQYNKKWLKYLLVFAIMGTIVSIIVRMFTPPKPKVNETQFIITNIDESQTQFAGINYSGSQISTPARFTVAKVEMASSLTGYIENQLTSDFNLILNQQLGDVWQGQNYSMYKDDVNKKYTLSANSSPIQEKVIEKQNSIEVANSFINKYFSSLELSLIEDDIGYFSGSFEPFQVPPEEAQTIKLYYGYKIQDYPVFYRKFSFHPFTITINSSLEIQKAEFQTFFAKFISQTSSKAITLERAVENINNNQASIIYAEQINPGQLSLEDIQSGKLTEVSIEYRVDEILMLAYPFYRFKGTLINNEDIEIEAEIITPAIETSK